MGKHREFLIYYDQYKHKIYTYFWYRVRFDQHIAEDLTADVFLKALKSFDSFDKSKSFQAWIYAIAKNHLADYYQKSGREINLEHAEEVLIENTNEIISKIDNQKKAKQIIEKINGLKSYHREVLLLRFVDELSNQEITNLLGKEENAVRTQISRAIAELRKKLSF